jgi:hypothetical protein
MRFIVIVPPAAPSWRWLLMQEVCLPLALALERAGSNIAAKIAMMAITTNSSMRVKARNASVRGEVPKHRVRASGPSGFGIFLRNAIRQ